MKLLREWWWIAILLFLGIGGTISGLTKSDDQPVESAYFEWVNEGRPFDYSCYLQNASSYESRYGESPPPDVEEGIQFSCRQ